MFAIDKTVCGEMDNPIFTDLAADNILAAGVKIERLFSLSGRHERGYASSFTARARQSWYGKIRGNFLRRFTGQFQTEVAWSGQLFINWRLVIGRSIFLNSL